MKHAVQYSNKTKHLKQNDKMQKVKALKDGDGHWYVIPNSKSDQFYSMLRDCEETDDYEPFEDTFGEYRTGGDLNLVQLYAEV